MRTAAVLAALPPPPGPSTHLHAQPPLNRRRPFPLRRARVADLLQHAGWPDSFRFGNSEGFDLSMRLRQSEPHKSLLAGPLPSRRVQLVPPPQAQRPQQQPGHPPAHPGVLTEQGGNQAGRRSGFHVPAKPPQPAQGGPDAQRRQQQPSAPQQQQPPQPPAQDGREAGRPPGGQGSRWASKLPRRADDPHVHASRRHGSSGDEEAGGHGGGSSDEEEESDLLQALAQQAAAFGTPLSAAPSQHQPTPFGSQQAGAGGSQPLGTPPSSQQASRSCCCCLRCSMAACCCCWPANSRVLSTRPHASALLAQAGGAPGARGLPAAAAPGGGAARGRRHPVLQPGSRGR